MSSAPVSSDSVPYLHYPSASSPPDPSQAVTGRLLHFPQNIRPQAPYNFASLGIQPFDDEFYDTILSHSGWTKYETLALLELVRLSGLDHLERDFSSDRLLSARHSTAECEARLAQIFALCSIYQHTFPSLTVQPNPYLQRAGDRNRDEAFNIPGISRREREQPRAAPVSHSASSPSAKKSGRHKKTDEYEPETSDSDSGSDSSGKAKKKKSNKARDREDDYAPRGGNNRTRSARLATQRRKSYAYADDSEDDFEFADYVDEFVEESAAVSAPAGEAQPAAPVDESDYIWRIEKILAERQRRVKRGEEEKPEEEDIIDQQLVSSTIQTVDQHRRMRFQQREEEKEKSAEASNPLESPQKPGFKKLEIDPTAEYVVITEYLIKIEGQSYLHVEWHTRDSLSGKFGDKAKDKIQRWNSAKNRIMESNLDKFGGEPFDPRHTLVDRVIDSKMVEIEPEPGQEPLKEEEKMIEMFLVKWQGLSYAEATWEVREDVDNESEIARFRRFNRPVSDDRQVTYSAQEFIERRNKWYSESPTYKNKMKLRDYQVLGLNWLISAWYDDRNCILADEMGLGKTVQVVSLFEHLRKVEYIFGPFMVVVPLGTLSHWKKEIETWTDMNVVIYHDPFRGNQTREIIRQHEFYYPGTQKVKFNVLVTTYEVLVADAEILSGIQWQHCAIDEGHRLKNKTSRLLEALRVINCNRRLLLTGTPIQNNTAELYTLLNFLEPEVFSSSSKFQSQFGNLEESAQVQALQERIRPYMLRRMKESVEKSIPPKEETIIDIELTTVQKKYYKAIYEKNFAFLRKGAMATGNMPRLVNVEMELRKVCNHPWLCTGAEETEIPKNATDVEYMRRTVAASGKMLLLDKLLPKLKADGHRVLIFSQMIPILDLIQDWCYFKGWAFERLDGSIRGNEREQALDRFNAPDSDRFIFLLTTRAGGVGLNLATADTVIIFDSDWNPQMDTQAMARAHRIGQKNKVSVYRLVTRNTYESVMFLRASKKLGLDHAVLTNLQLGTEIDENDKSTIDKILKLGAYGILDEEESNAKSKEFEESNIDDILRTRAHVVQVSKNPRAEGDAGGEILPIEQPSGEEGVKKNFGLNYTKMKFSTGDTGGEIDIDDPAFWDKVLGNKVEDYMVPADELLGQLTDGTAFSDPKAKANFWTNMAKTVESVLKRRSAGEDVPELDSVVSLLIQFCEVSHFTRAQRDQARFWLDESDKRVERKARTKTNQAELEELMRLKNQTRERGFRGRRHGSDSESEDFESPETDSEYELGHGEPSSAMEVGGRRKGRLGVAMNSELCAICHQSGSMLGCEAGCCRWFHLQCLGMTEDSVPPESVNWLCPDCATFRQKCWGCGEIGNLGPDATENIVKRCIVSQCGKYFHLDCVRKFPLASFVKEGTDIFRCPCHMCARCDQSDSTMWLVWCETCTIGLHVKCMNKEDVRLGRRSIYCDNCSKTERKSDRGKLAIAGAQRHTQLSPVRKRQRLKGVLAAKYGKIRGGERGLGDGRPRRPVARGLYKPGVYTIRVYLEGEKVHELIKHPMFQQNERQRRRRRTAAEMAEARRKKEERREMRRRNRILRMQGKTRRGRAGGTMIELSDISSSESESSDVDSETDESEGEQGRAQNGESGSENSPLLNGNSKKRALELDGEGPGAADNSKRAKQEPAMDGMPMQMPAMGLMPFPYAMMMMPQPMPMGLVANGESDVKPKSDNAALAMSDQ